MAENPGSGGRARYVLGYGACALAAMLWGTGFFFGKIALAEMSVPHMLFYRFAFACLAMAPLVVRHATRLQARQWWILLLASFLGIPLQFFSQYYGLSLTTVAHASLMIGTLPMFMALVAILFFHERLDTIGWIAIVASTVGVALTVLGHKLASTGGDRPTVAGDLLVVLSLIIALGWIFLNKRLMERHPPVVITAYGVLSGSLMLFPIVVAVKGLPPIHGVSGRAWLALACSGFLCTASTTLLWNWGLHRVPASRAGIFLNLEPVVGSLLGITMFGDRLGPLAGVGGGLIIAAAIALSAHGHAEAGELM